MVEMPKLKVKLETVTPLFLGGASLTQAMPSPTQIGIFCYA